MIIQSLDKYRRLVTNKNMIVVACPDQGASYDQEAFIHACCQVATNVVDRNEDSQVSFV